MLLYEDNYQFWTDPTLGTFNDFGNNPGSVTVTGGRLFGTNSAFALVSSNITSQDTYIINMRVNVNAVGNGSLVSFPSDVTAFANLCEGGATAGRVQTALCLRSDAKLQFQSNGSFIGAVSPSALVIDNGLTFYDVEYKIKVNTSTGTIEARLNGGPEIGPTGSLNTARTGNNFADSIVLWAYEGISFNSPDMLVEHFIIMDGSGGVGNDFIGPVDVDLLTPTGNGNYTGWSANGAATQWECVDELNPDEDTTYINASAVGTKQTFTHSNTLPGVTSVINTFFWTRARRDDGVTRSFKLLLRSSGSDQLGTQEHFLAEDYIWFRDGFPSSPFTSSPWGVSEVVALEFGEQVTA